MSSWSCHQNEFIVVISPPNLSSDNRFTLPPCSFLVVRADYTVGVHQCGWCSTCWPSAAAAVVPRPDFGVRLNVQAEKLVKKYERMGAVLGDLGLSFIKVSRYEEVEGTERARFTDTVSCAQALSSDTKNCGIALVRLARLARKVTSKMAQDLGELHDYMSFMPVRYGIGIVW